MPDRHATRSPVRVALRIAGDPVPAFLADAAERVLRVAGAEVVLVLSAEHAPPRTRKRREVRRAAESLYASLERRALPGGRAALAARTFDAAGRHIPVLLDAGGAAQADAIRDAAIDVIIDLAPSGDADPLPIPPQGRWSIRFANGIGGPRGARLVRPASRVALAESLLTIRLPTGVRVESDIGVTSLHRIAFARDRDAVYWRSALLPARRLARLAAGDAVPSLLIDTQPTAPAEAVVPIRRPVPGAPFRALAGTVLHKALERLQFRSEWCVLVREGGGNAPGILPGDLAGFRPVDPPPGRFYADPFVVTTPQGPRIYVEDSPDGVHRGRITLLKPAPGATWTPERVVLADLEHRAYPHALRTEAGLILTPDSGRSGGVDVFLDLGAEASPTLLTRCLEGVPASDPTLLWHEGRYWLFVAVTEPGMSPWDELHAYFATDLTGSWHPHAFNPVVADVRSARPAGRIFRWGTALIRPGQDCSERYGGRIVLSAITTLTPHAYAERRVACIEPMGMPGFSRTHTYTFDGSVEALDGYRQVRRRPGRTRRQA